MTSNETFSYPTKDLKWHRYYLDMAKHVSTMSKDPSTKVGAVIVDPVLNSVVSTGYNGFPDGVEDLPERIADRDTKLMLTAHAEANAIWRSPRRPEGCDIYVYPTLMIPGSCPQCALGIKQSGIKRVFYYKNYNLSKRWEDLAKFTRIIFDEGGVQYCGIDTSVYEDCDE